MTVATGGVFALVVAALLAGVVGYAPDAARAAGSGGVDPQATPVRTALAAYDRARRPDALRHATDLLVDEGGQCQAKPAERLAFARARLALWVAVLSRLGRDADPAFDPSRTPPLRPPAPVIDGQPVPPWAWSAGSPDPELRARFKVAAEGTNRRMAAFSAGLERERWHRDTVRRAADAIAGLQARCGLPILQVEAAVSGGRLLPADLAVLRGGPPPDRTVAIPAPTPAIARLLAAYDQDRQPPELSEAISQAGLGIDETRPSPAATSAALLRLRDWIAILARLHRDIDPAFDAAHPPAINIVPPATADGSNRQYPSGVDPKDVTDPELRRRYVAALAENRRQLEEYGRMAKLIEGHATALRDAAEFAADARRLLRVTRSEMMDVLDTAPIAAPDRATLTRALR